MVDDFLMHLAAAGVSAGTISLRRAHLNQLAAYRPLELVTSADLEAWLGRPGLSRDYRRSLRATVRAYYAYRSKITGCDNPAADLPVIAAQPPRPRPTAEQAYKAALEHAPERVALMIRLAGEIGLRRAEVAVIGQGDLMPDLLGYSLMVHGKGNKDRLLPLEPGLAAAIRCGLTGERWLFPNGQGGHLTPAHVGKLVSAELPEGVTMHSLRHRFATRVYAASHDLLACQQLLGHANPATTQAYVRIERDRLRQVAAAATLAA